MRKSVGIPVAPSSPAALLAAQGSGVDSTTYGLVSVIRTSTAKFGLKPLKSPGHRTSHHPVGLVDPGEVGRHVPGNPG